MVLAHYGRWESIENLRAACGVSRDGSTAADLVVAATAYGLKATGWRKSVGELRQLAMPVILFWGFNHFVVLEGFERGGYCLNDPANGRRVVGEEAFSREFTGVVLTMELGPDFRPGGLHPGLMRRLLPWLREVKGPLAFVALCGLLLALPGLLLPILLSVFLDHVLDGSNADWGGLVVAGAGAAAVLIYLLTWLQQRALRRVAVRLSLVHSERLLSRLFRLPADYFSHRHAGVLTSQVRLVDRVAASASRQFVGAVVELVMSGLFLALMFFFDPLLAAVVAGLGAGNVALMHVVSSQRTDQNRQLQREQALLFGIGAFGLRNMDHLRATAEDDEFYALWTGYQARELAAPAAICPTRAPYRGAS